MRTHLEQNCEGVDASVFSGDVLYDDEERAELKAYVERWARAIAEHEAVEAEESAEAVKQRAYALDPECWVSYSGKDKAFKQAMDKRRTTALACAQSAPSPVDSFNDLA